MMVSLLDASNLILPRVYHKPLRPVILLFSCLSFVWALVFGIKFLQDQSLPSFQQLGSLPCQSVCLWSSSSNQWTSLGNGLRGVANQVELLGSYLEELVALGRFQLNSTVGDVSIAHWGFDEQQKSWVGIGNQSTIPRSVRLVTVGGKGDLEVDGFFIGRDLESGLPYSLRIALVMFLL
ncbi:hypothetical protein BY996DRAFT_8500469 [Phakopsora pachyrhizi]|uniref:Rax2-like C-terminal domain-containing protein n=1 Tax=Phakopsora pachyrhizi TaxID=170000 RepID=A0AAV0AJN1_PHAPC|nr:hypothetical protein BY996DRAFT_8500469 [Phakopsora pachyrhizi]CAH7667987.1 hypothetical protein PPACK8108_LOCUS2445 [Phakopsora pachyrhizi]